MPAMAQSSTVAAHVEHAVERVKTGIQALLPDIRARAAECERVRRVPSDTFEALRAIGLYKLVQPAAFGGYEQDFTVLMELTMQLSAACASSGWVCGLLSAHQWMVGLYPKNAQEDVWGENPDATFCGSYAPVNEARPVSGGYRLSGRWSFASGCDNADWAICAARIPASGDQPAYPAFLIVPARDYRIDDTWDVIGLAGTGSKTLVLDDVFVPGHRLISFADAASGHTPGSRLYANRVFSVPVYSHISPCLAATAVGAAAGVIEDFIDASSGRITRGSVTGGNNRMADFPTVQIRVAEAAASVDAARTILLRDTEAITREVRHNGEASVKQRIINRRGQAFAVKLAVQAVDTLNAAMGGNGLAMSNPVQRAWRDVNAVARHVSLNWDAVATMYGQMALGLEPRGQY